MTASAPATTAPPASPLAALYVGRRLDVLGVAAGVSLTSNGNGVAFAVPLSQQALVVLCIVDGFTAAKVDSGIVLSYGYSRTVGAGFFPSGGSTPAYGDLFSQTLGGIVGGGVTALSIDAQGSGYTTAPTLSFTSQGSGSGATATATTDGDKVDTTTITNPGHGYTAPPLVAITGGGGSGAAISATIGDASVAPTPIIVLQSPYTARVAGGFTIHWAITNAIAGSGTCNLTWLGSLL